MQKTSLSEISKAIAALPEDWHGAGSMSHEVIDAMAALCAKLQPIRLSVETGSGKTTLLFSHASPKHKVFALDGGNGSISRVRESSLFNAASVEYIEGSTQVTLPAFKFDGAIDIALIDGPHGYPFPELEYYHLYPRIRQGGFLLLDDIHIPTIGRMFEILAADKMWKLHGVVGKLAIFERTGHEGVSPLEDGWWKQGFNEPLWRDINAPAPGFLYKWTRPLVRWLPKRVKDAAKILIRGRL